MRARTYDPEARASEFRRRENRKGCRRVDGVIELARAGQIEPQRHRDTEKKSEEKRREKEKEE